MLYFYCCNASIFAMLLLSLLLCFYFCYCCGLGTDPWWGAWSASCLKAVLQATPLLFFSFFLAFDSCIIGYQLNGLRSIFDASSFLNCLILHTKCFKYQLSVDSLPLIPPYYSPLGYTHGPLDYAKREAPLPQFLQMEHF
jgi:hypothetical protein